MDIGEAAVASIFQPDLQTDYEMKCEGMDERNGQPDWVVDFQQRKDRPSRTVNVRVDNVVYPGSLKGRAWISTENFQIVYVEANLTGGLAAIGLQELAFSVDDELVRTPSANLGLWLPDRIVTYWNFDAHRVILSHTFADFQFFTVETKEKVQEPKEP